MIQQVTQEGNFLGSQLSFLACKTDNQFSGEIGKRDNLQAIFVGLVPMGHFLNLEEG